MTDTLPTLPVGAVLDYDISGDRFLSEGETIVQSGSSITVAGATKDSVTFSPTDVKIWLSGATPATPIRINALLKTSGGRTYRAFYIIPYGEPVTLDMAKAQCRVLDDTSEDELIASYITAAREYVEEQTGHILVQRAFTESRDRFCRFIEIARRPIVSGSITVGYTDTDGATQAYTDFIVSAVRYPARIYPALNGWWPTMARDGEISITYIAGYADGDAPARAVQAILLLVGHWYSQREAGVSDMRGTPAEVPFAVTALLDQMRGCVL